MTLRIVLEPSEEGGFTATVPSLPGCISEGRDREEALKNIQEAIELYCEPVEDDEQFSELPLFGLLHLFYLSFRYAHERFTTVA